MRRVVAAKDGHTRRENVRTQPLVEHRAFNNPDVLTEGWYPLCPSGALARGQARSFVVGAQRVAAYRGEDGTVRALDAFCPHMGADLGNGKVIGDELRCYFHHWQFDGQGTLVKLGTKDKRPAKACVNAWPVEEKYGHIWVYSARVARHPVPVPPGLEGEDVEAIQLMEVTLYAHHHVMMLGGIDLQHFATVHDLDIDFQLDVDAAAEEVGVVDWKLRGELKDDRWRARLGRWLFGRSFGYDVRFAGGSVATITYGPGARFRGEGRPLPTLHLLWGCLPRPDGISDVRVFVLVKKQSGALDWFRRKALEAATVGLLAILQDDDVKAFPHMRFDPANLTASDRSAARFIRYVNGLPLSPWSRTLPNEEAPRPDPAPREAESPPASAAPSS